MVRDISQDTKGPIFTPHTMLNKFLWLQIRHPSADKFMDYQTLSGSILVFVSVLLSYSVRAWKNVFFNFCQFKGRSQEAMKSSIKTVQINLKGNFGIFG